jgi:hypothetical protein
VFTNITRKQYAQTDLHEVFPEDRCVFKDEMSESADAEVFRARFWKMVPSRVRAPMTLPEFDRLRGLLFPEIRIRQIALPLEAKPAASEDRVLEVMDLHQEQVARGLGEGHRIIRGVAGSGKTLILAFRAEYLARAAAKPVLILCFANGIAGRHRRCDAGTRRRRSRPSPHVSFLVLPDAEDLRYPRAEVFLTYSQDSGMVRRLIA